MRISGGKHLNRKIATKTKINKNIDYRPTSDRSRQAIFNIILNSPKIPEGLIEGASVMDICCGCGSFTLEALSRGAANSVLIDVSKEQLGLAKYNAQILGEEDNCSFIKANATNLPYISSHVDIIFIDPPYYEKNEINILNSIKKSGMLNSETLVILEVQNNFPSKKIDDFEILIEREYGKTKLLFLKII